MNSPHTQIDKLNIAAAKVNLILWWKLTAGNLTDVIPCTQEDGLYYIGNQIISMKNHFFNMDKDNDAGKVEKSALRCIGEEVEYARTLTRLKEATVRERDQLSAPQAMVQNVPVPNDVYRAPLPAQMGQYLDISNSVQLLRNELEFHHFRQARLRMMDFCLPIGATIPNVDNQLRCVKCPHFADVVSYGAECPEKTCRFFCQYLALKNIAAGDSYFLPHLLLTYCQIKGIGQKSAVRRLCQKFEINPTAPFQAAPISESSGWDQVGTNWYCPPPSFGGELVHFCDEDGFGLGWVVKSKGPDGTPVLTPWTGWSYLDNRIVLTLPIPIRAPYPLLNLDKIVAVESGGRILISDDLSRAWALRNECTMQQAATAFLGGLDVIEKVDWKPLHGRNVEYVISDSIDTDDRKEAYKTAIAVGKKLESFGVNFDITESYSQYWRKPSFPVPPSMLLAQPYFEVPRI